MLSEEEKKAIKIIEETHDMLVNPKLREEKYTTDDFEKAFYVVIMLIRKQQEKIVDLETKLSIETIDNKYNQEERDEETIPRYKIREKLKELKKCKDISQVVGSIVILEELLEDNKNESKM